MKTYRCPTCGKALTKSEYEKALHIHKEREKHYAEKEAELEQKEKQFRVKERQLRQENQEKLREEKQKVQQKDTGRVREGHGLFDGLCVAWKHPRA